MSTKTITDIENPEKFEYLDSTTDYWYFIVRELKSIVVYIESSNSYIAYHLSDSKFVSSTHSNIAESKCNNCNKQHKIREKKDFDDKNWKFMDSYMSLSKATIKQKKLGTKSEKIDFHKKYLSSIGIKNNINICSQCRSKLRDGVHTTIEENEDEISASLL